MVQNVLLSSINLLNNIFKRCKWKSWEHTDKSVSLLCQTRPRRRISWNHAKTRKTEVIGYSQHGFTEGKSCLTKVVTFHDRVTAQVDGARETDIVYLDSGKVFDTVLHHFHVSKLERHGSDEWTALWIRIWLDGTLTECAHRGSIWRPVMSGISWVSTGADAVHLYQ